MCNRTTVSYLYLLVSVVKKMPEIFIEKIFLITLQRFPPNCQDPEYIPMNDVLMTLFLDGHNELRNQHALGQTGGIFNETTVADMATIVS